jgi:hypothetical protein
MDKRAIRASALIDSDLRAPLEGKVIVRAQIIVLALEKNGLACVGGFVLPRASKKSSAPS